MPMYRVQLERTYSSEVILRADDEEEAENKADSLRPEELNWILNQHEIFDIEEVPSIGWHIYRLSPHPLSDGWLNTL